MEKKLTHYFYLLIFCLNFKRSTPRSKLYTLSGRIGKVVALHAAVARSSPAECTDLY